MNSTNVDDAGFVSWSTSDGKKGFCSKEDGEGKRLKLKKDDEESGSEDVAGASMKRCCGISKEGVSGKVG